MIRVSRALLVGIVLLLAATHAWAQATAQINGTVADSSGGVLPGVAVDTGNPSSRSLTSSRGVAIAGGQQFGVAYLLDGALHNNVYDGTGLPLPFPDALQEFRVETGSQNAQNGYKAGGTVGIATKSGTNLFHGNAFEFARHHRFNATSP